MRKYFAPLIVSATILVALAGCDGLLGLASSITGSPRPAAPSGLRIPVTVAGAVRLEWQDNALNETGYEIQRLVTAATSYEMVAETVSDVVEFVDADTEPGMEYSYRLRATNEFGASDWKYSNKISPPYMVTTGDTYGVETQQYDIVGVGVSAAAPEITLYIGGTVYPPTDAARGLIGFVEIDVDSDPGTGVESSLNGLGPEAPAVEMGVEYMVNLMPGAPEVNGIYQMEVVDTSGLEAPRIALVTYGVTWVRIRMPGTEIDLDDGECVIGVIVGTQPEPTDEAGPLHFY